MSRHFRCQYPPPFLELHIRRLFLSRFPASDEYIADPNTARPSLHQGSYRAETWGSRLIEIWQSTWAARGLLHTVHRVVVVDWNHVVTTQSLFMVVYGILLNFAKWV